MVTSGKLITKTLNSFHPSQIMLREGLKNQIITEYSALLNKLLTSESQLKYLAANERLYKPPVVVVILNERLGEKKSLLRWMLYVAFQKEKRATARALDYELDIIDTDSSVKFNKNPSEIDYSQQSY